MFWSVCLFLGVLHESENGLIDHPVKISVVEVNCGTV